MEVQRKLQQASLAKNSMTLTGLGMRRSAGVHKPSQKTPLCRDELSDKVI